MPSEVVPGRRGLAGAEDGAKTLYKAEAAELPKAGQLNPPEKLALESAGPAWNQTPGGGGTAPGQGGGGQPKKKKRGCLVFVIIVLILVVVLLGGSTAAYFIIGPTRVAEMLGLTTVSTELIVTPGLPDGGVAALLPDGGVVTVPTIPPIVPPVVPTGIDGGVALPTGDAGTAPPATGDAGAAPPPAGDAAAGDAAATPPAETPPAETPPAETPPDEGAHEEDMTPARYISRAQSRLRRIGAGCLRRSSAHGRVTLSVSLRQTGTVARASVRGNTTGDDALGRCLSGAVVNQRLGRPPGGVHTFDVTFSR